MEMKHFCAPYGTQKCFIIIILPHAVQMLIGEIYFQVDVAIIEVGIGGTYDYTNVVRYKGYPNFV